MTKKRGLTVGSNSWRIFGLPVVAFLSVGSAATALDYPVVIHRGNGLANTFEKLNTGQRATIAYIGGSVTQAPGWRDNVTAWFNSRYPGRITEVNAGWSGTGSLIGAMRLARDVLVSRPDLIFVEFAINDLPEDALLFIERNTEGMVRQAWTQNAGTDVCFIETISYYIEQPYLSGYLPTTVQAHYNVCDHYGCPSVNVGWALYEQVLAGTPWTDLAPDRVHPNAAGSLIYSNAVIGYLEAECVRGGASAAHNMPAALTDFPVTGSTITNMVTVSPLPSGWSAHYNEFGVASFVQSSTANSTINVGFTGPAAAAKIIVSSDSGDITYSVDGGGYAPGNVPVNGYTFLWAFPVCKTASFGAHTLSLRVSSGTARIINVEAPTSTGGGPGPDETNFAPAATAAQADSVYGAGWDAARACDGLTSTKWCSTGATQSHWLALDLGRTLDVKHFVVRHAGSGGEWSMYNTEAFTIESGPGLSGPWSVEFTGSNPHQLDVSTFAYATPKPLRYVRLNISDPGIDNYARIPEFEVWGTPPPPPPVADFAGSPTDGNIPLTVRFVDQSTGSITSRLWDFGDGGQSTATNPTHVYTEAGTYSVSLIVAGPGGSDSETKTDYIVARFMYGDFDDDGDVDLSDFNYFQACFNGPNRAYTLSECPRTDVDHDGDADLSDFARFQACFNGPNRTPACQT